MSKTKQLVLAALMALASTAAMAGKGRDMGMISHGVGPAMEEAAVQTAVWDGAVPQNDAGGSETAIL